LAAYIDGDLLRQITLGDRDRDIGDVAHLVGQVRRHRVDVLGEILPGARGARHLRLAAELALGADLARDAPHIARKALELFDPRFLRVVLPVYLAAYVDGDLLRQVAVGDRGRDLGDVAHLVRQVRRHRVDVVGEVLPHARDALHLRLAAELAVRADLAR